MPSGMAHVIKIADVGAENHPILVRLGEVGRRDPLTERVVERIIDAGGRDAEAGRRRAVDGHLELFAVEFEIARHVLKLRHRTHTVDEPGNPSRKSRLVRILEEEQILRLSHRAVDGQVLDRLHRDRDSRYAFRLLTKPPNNLDRRFATLVARLKRDEHTPAVERGVHPVDADEGGEAGDIFVFENDIGEGLLPASHLGEGDILGRAGYALYCAGVLIGRSLWNLIYCTQVTAASMPTATMRNRT